MKKGLSLLLALLLTALLSTALAVTEGDITWQEETLTVTGISLTPMFAPVGMADDERPVAVTLRVSAALAADEDLLSLLYAQIKLVDPDGTAYAAGTATSNNKEPLMTYYFAVPEDADVDAMEIAFMDAVPAEYVGDWAGSADGISLAFTVNADGTGLYAFTQGDYSESYDFVMTVADASFTVDIPADNKSGITACEGTYAYADDVLTLDVTTTFQGGRTMAYTIACARAEA